MTETRTLQFENARAVQSLYANDLKLIKNLEESLGVKVTTREGWIKLEGEPEQVSKAERVFAQLESARKRGADIQRHEFNYALNSVNEARPDNLGDLVDGLGEIPHRVGCVVCFFLWMVEQLSNQPACRRSEKVSSQRAQWTARRESQR
jgi:hypothetical protein